MSNETVHAMSVEQIETLKVSAQNMGFDGDTVANVLEKFGPDVLSLLVEAARSGFNVAWIVDTIAKFGPTVLQFFVDLWHKNAAFAAPMGMEGTGVVLPDSVMVEGMDANLLQTLLEKFLPIILEKYGPQLIQMLMDAILNAIKPKSVGMTDDEVVAEVAARARLFDGTVIQSVIEKLLPTIMEKYGPQLIQMLMDAIMNAIKTK